MSYSFMSNPAICRQSWKHIKTQYNCLVFCRAILFVSYAIALFVTTQHVNTLCSSHNCFKRRRINFNARLVNNILIFKNINVTFLPTRKLTCMAQLRWAGPQTSQKRGVCACTKKSKVAPKKNELRICQIFPFFLLYALFSFLWHFWNNIMGKTSEHEKSACAKENTLESLLGHVQTHFASEELCSLVDQGFPLVQIYPSLSLWWIGPDACLAIKNCR